MYRHAGWRLRKDLCERVRRPRVSGDPGRDVTYDNAITKNSQKAY
jgi:hypothetical protein